jgi:hypothetical protein
LKEGGDMKSTLTLLIRTITIACLIFAGINVFSQADNYASGKRNKALPKDNMPVIKPESHDSIPVIHPNSKDPMPTINPDTASKLVPNTIVNPKKKKTARNNYNYPAYGNHFGDNRIGIMVGRSDNRRQKRKVGWK